MNRFFGNTFFGKSQYRNNKAYAMKTKFSLYFVNILLLIFYSFIFFYRFTYTVNDLWSKGTQQTSLPKSRSQEIAQEVIYKKIFVSSNLI